MYQEVCFNRGTEAGGGGGGGGGIDFGYLLSVPNHFSLATGLQWCDTENAFERFLRYIYYPVNTNFFGFEKETVFYLFSLEKNIVLCKIIPMRCQQFE